MLIGFIWLKWMNPRRRRRNLSNEPSLEKGIYREHGNYIFRKLELTQIRKEVQLTKKLQTPLEDWRKNLRILLTFGVSACSSAFLLKSHCGGDRGEGLMRRYEYFNIAPESVLCVRFQSVPLDFKWHLLFLSLSLVCISGFVSESIIPSLDSADYI